MEVYMRLKGQCLFLSPPVEGHTWGEWLERKKKYLHNIDIRNKCGLNLYHWVEGMEISE